MRSCVILLAVLISTQAWAGPAWRWVDADGVVHYSDRPVPGAVEVYLPDAATPSVPPSASVNAQQTRSSATTPNNATPGATAQNAQYSQLAITSPAADETLWNIGGELTVQVAVEPEIQPGHRLTLIYDGSPVRGASATATSFQLGEVYRGIHTVQAVIIDANDTPVLRSMPVEFVVQQTSIANPVNPQRN